MVYYIMIHFRKTEQKSSGKEGGKEPVLQILELGPDFIYMYLPLQ